VKTKNIFFVGFMGSGKTFFGKKLSKKWNRPFVDLDLYIEQKMEKSIDSIFKEYGEHYFRKLENQFLKELSAQENLIISCGGGTPIFHNNLEIMKKSGIVIYIKQPKEILLGRLRRNKQKRPLVQKLNDDELKAFINHKLEEREKFYKQANIIIESPNVEKIEHQILTFS
jgi:shikimate kinase